MIRYTIFGQNLTRSKILSMRMISFNEHIIEMRFPQILDTDAWRQVYELFRARFTGGNQVKLAVDEQQASFVRYVAETPFTITTLVNPELTEEEYCRLTGYTRPPLVWRKKDVAPP